MASKKPERPEKEPEIIRVGLGDYIKVDYFSEEITGWVVEMSGEGGSILVDTRASANHSSLENKGWTHDGFDEIARGLNLIPEHERGRYWGVDFYAKSTSVIERRIPIQPDLHHSWQSLENPSLNAIRVGNRWIKPLEKKPKM